uniref:Immunoglobulin V-set domain-containing protein n=1 Tax=Amphiprion percula TaxID=161767 RepID=A0A3P8TZ66_AMPPE
MWLWVLQPYSLHTHKLVSAQLSAPDVVTGTYNGSVTISCQYDLQFKENTKYWCKGSVYELCAIVVKTPKNRFNDRSSIVDDQEAGVFTVTMTSLRKPDEDRYWCVIARSGRNIFRRVKLLISNTGIIQLHQHRHFSGCNTILLLLLYMLALILSKVDLTPKLISVLFPLK